MSATETAAEAVDVRVLSWLQESDATAAVFLEQDQENALKWLTNIGGGVAQGAATGAAAGPWGALIGGVLGGALSAAQTANPQQAPRPPTPPTPPTPATPATPPTPPTPPAQPAQPVAAPRPVATAPSPATPGPRPAAPVPPASTPAPAPASAGTTGSISPQTLQTLAQQLLPMLIQTLAQAGSAPARESLDGDITGASYRGDILPDEAFLAAEGVSDGSDIASEPGSTSNGTVPQDGTASMADPAPGLAWEWEATDGGSWAIESIGDLSFEWIAE